MIMGFDLNKNLRKHVNRIGTTRALIETAFRAGTWAWTLLDCEMSLRFLCKTPWWDHRFGPLTVSVQSGNEVTGLQPTSVKHVSIV